MRKLHTGIIHRGSAIRSKNAKAFFDSANLIEMKPENYGKAFFALIDKNIIRYKKGETVERKT